MELNWSTFILEIINFLVLIWLLKRFLYAPIQAIIIKRKDMLEKKLTDANQLQADAENLQVRYENRLQEWGLEKEKYQNQFQQELEEWRSQEHVKSLKKMDEERLKLQSQEKQNINKMIEKNANEAMFIAGQFASKFLSQFADVALQNKLIELLLNDIRQFSEDRVAILKNGYKNENKIIVQSAYPIPEADKKRLTDGIGHLINETTEVQFMQNPGLLAGINIQIGSISLKASVRDELKFFTEVARETS